MTSGFANPLARHTPAVVLASRDIKQWTRDALGLGETDAVFVNELACSVAGCPPKETIIVVMRAGRATGQVSIHKALVEVTPQDIDEALHAQARRNWQRG
jgi:hypothetical protein